MEILSDALLAAGAFGAALYCFILQGRLKRFTALDSGMGGAIAVLSAQVDDMTRALAAAQAAAAESSDSLESRVARAEAAAARLDLLLASLHDLPDPAASPPAPHLRVVRRRSPHREEVVE